MKQKRLLVFLFLLTMLLPLNVSAKAKETYRTGYLKADITNMTSPVTVVNGSNASVSTVTSSASASTSISKSGSVTSKQVNALYKALKNFKKSVNLKSYKVYYTDMQTLLDKAFTKDYYVQDAISTVGIQYQYNYKGYVENVYFTYNYKQSTMRNRYNSLKKAVASAKKSIGTNLSDIEAAVAIHDYIIKTTTFNTSYANKLAANPKLDPVFRNHTAYGVLCKGSAVCSGYAYAYRILLHEYGIESEFIESEDMNHGWNMIKLNNRWYHVDVTWDDPDANIHWTGNGSGDLVYYTYFLLNNKEIFNADHYSWSPSKTSSSTTYSNMPRYSSEEQVFYEENWYMILNNESLYKYMCYSMTGDETLIATSVSPFYLWNGRLIYQPDSQSLSSMNVDGSMIRSHLDSVLVSGITEGTEFTLEHMDQTNLTFLLAYEETIEDTTGVSNITTQTKTITLTDYDLRTSDYADSLSLSNSKITLKKGRYKTLTASIGPVWALNTKVVFKVNTAGKKVIQTSKTTDFTYRFKAIKKGTATITVTVPNTSLKKTCKVTVK